ncbi:hypothetical protein F5X68DRAFT_260013 [Plectosphaerella plurivora]|uniref:Uncharacterized protein n=1 Tax=Plectosphaerella plurivora TaxID=936078 RepID=A0A9P8VHY7_9PEZI|nr:hypothetical protein F5X68DRAFT_260013 [Plectosphaerella plurivora]
MSTTNAWLQRQRKSDLIEIAELVGLQDYEGHKKVDLEVSLDSFLSANADKLANEPKVAPYYNSRARAAGSPTKRDMPKIDLKSATRRATRYALEELDAMEANSEREENASSTALVARTPARNLSLASRISLPASPAEVAEVVDRHTVAVRERVSEIYQDSGITERTHAVRESLSTVTSIIFTVFAFELYSLRPEVLPGRYAFTLPAIAALHTDAYPVYVPDMFLVLTSYFWSPVLTWVATSVLVPSLFGYFYNLSAASHTTTRRTRASHVDYNIDPLVFSIVKALISFIVYGQGATFNGLINPASIQRINQAIYGEWKGILTGAAITGLASLYDAVLRK